METNSVNEFLTSFDAMIGSFLGGVISILFAFSKILELYLKIKENLRHLFNKEKETKIQKGEKKMEKINYKPLSIGLFLLSVSGIIFSYRYSGAQNIPLNQKLAKEAWDYFNNSDYEKAIGKADECIGLFRGQAEIKQEELVKLNVHKPVTTPSEVEKKEIFSRGLLNDVATCYYIKGLSYKELRNNEDATKSFIKAEKFSYAMCWDPQGWFWNISEAAAGKLRELENE
jgi:tetratricopeptide (TPR) repeat protein